MPFLLHSSNKVCNVCLSYFTPCLPNISVHIYVHPASFSLADTCVPTFSPVAHLSKIAVRASFFSSACHVILQVSLLQFFLEALLTTSPVLAALLATSSVALTGCLSLCHSPHSPLLLSRGITSNQGSCPTTSYHTGITRCCNRDGQGHLLLYSPQAIFILHSLYLYGYLKASCLILIG